MIFRKYRITFSSKKDTHLIVRPDDVNWIQKEVQEDYGEEDARGGGARDASTRGGGSQEWKSDSEMEKWYCFQRIQYKIQKKPRS